MKTLARFALLIGFLCTAGTGNAETPAEGFRTTTKQSPYTVQGDSIAKLTAELNEKGPLDHGEKFHAKTDRQIHWHYRYERKGGGFAITTLTVTADIDCLLPRRTVPANQPDNLAAQWERYMAALTLHEHGHGQNAIDHAKALYATLRAHRVFATSQALEEFIRAEGDKCIADANAYDVEYDRKTKHGATQGATLR